MKYFPNIDASVVTANISKSELQNIVDNLTLTDVYPLSKTVAGSIGIEPNKYITSAEGMDISTKSKAFMSDGVREIISNSDGVKPAYSHRRNRGMFVSVMYCYSYALDKERKGGKLTNPPIRCYAYGRSSLHYQRMQFYNFLN